MRRLFAKILGRRLDNMSAEHKAGLFGVGWTTLGTFAGLIIRFASTLILTRLLVPGDYGMFDLAFTLVLIAELLSDFGLRPALVQHPKGETPEFVGTAWALLLIRGLVLSLVVFSLSWILPPFYPEYDDRKLGNVIAVLSVKSFMHSLCNPMMLLLHKQMRFGRWSLLEFSQTFFGVASSLVWGYLHRDIWAIVMGTLVGEAAFIAMTYILCSRPPRPRFDRDAAKALAHVGNQVFVNTLVMALWLYLPKLIAPRYMTPADMGLYVIAWNLMEVVERLAAKASDVYYTMLTKLPTPEAQIAFHEKFCRKVAGYAMPLLAVGVMLAPTAIRILYKREYHGAAVLFAILMARVMTRILGQLHFQLLLAQAKIYLATRCYLLALAVQLAIILPLVIGYTTEGLAYSVLISTTVYTFAQNWIFVRKGWMSLWSFNYTLAAIAASLPLTLFIEKFW